MNKILGTRTRQAIAAASTAVFGLAILCSMALILYAGLLSGWNWQFFWVLASKTLFLEGVVLPIIGIPVAWHLRRAPTIVEEGIECAVLLVCWISALYVIYTSLGLVLGI